MLTAFSSTTFHESRVLSALLLERRFRAHMMWRHRLLFDSRLGVPSAGGTPVATIYIALEGSFEVDGVAVPGSSAYCVAASEYERVTQGSRYFRSWGDPSVTLDLELEASDVCVPIGLRHGPLALSAATWAALNALADALATEQPVDGRMRDVLAGLIADGIVAPSLADAVVDEPPWATRLWEALRPHYRSMSASVSVLELARAAGLSLRQLRRDAKQLTETFALFGANFRETLHTLRLRLVVLLLSARESTVREVAARAGYQSCDALARAFRDAGMSAPSVVRAVVKYPRDPMPG